MLPECVGDETVLRGDGRSSQRGAVPHHGVIPLKHRLVQTHLRMIIESAQRSREQILTGQPILSQCHLVLPLDPVQTFRAFHQCGLSHALVCMALQDCWHCPHRGLEQVAR